MGKHEDWLGAFARIKGIEYVRVDLLTGATSSTELRGCTHVLVHAKAAV